MEYNLAGIRERVIIDKLDDEEFDPGIVDRFINDTQREIFNTYELSFQEKIFSGTILAGSAVFNFPSDVAQVQSHTVTGPDGSQHNIQKGYVPFRDFNKVYPTPLNNQPAGISTWTLFANNMMLSQPTDKEYTMTIFYIKKPTTLVENSAIPEIPEEFSELLVLGAYMRIQQRNEDFDLADKTAVEYNKQLALLVNRYGFRQMDGPVTMKSSQVSSRKRRG